MFKINILDPLVLELRILLLLVISIVIYSIILEIAELSYYINTGCSVQYYNYFSPVWMYLSFILTNIIKLCMLNLFYSELKERQDIGKKKYKMFLVPGLIYGISPSANAPIYIFDYAICEQRHPFLTVSFSGKYLIIICIGYITIITSLVMICIFTPNFKINQTIIKRIRNILYWILAGWILIVNIISLLIFIQVFVHFVPALMMNFILFFTFGLLCLFSQKILELKYI